MVTSTELRGQVCIAPNSRVIFWLDIHGLHAGYSFTKCTARIYSKVSSFACRCIFYSPTIRHRRAKYTNVFHVRKVGRISRELQKTLVLMNKKRYILRGNNQNTWQCEWNNTREQKYYKSTALCSLLCRVPKNTWLYN